MSPFNPDTVKIGNQIWMKKNLNILNYCNGDPIKLVSSEEEWVMQSGPACCYPDFNSYNGNDYGLLYNWTAVNDPRGLAPKGWHVSTDEEWKELEIFLGMQPEYVDRLGSAGWGNAGGDENIGGKLKENGTIHWLQPNSGATNESGFSALPGGFCYPPGFRPIFHDLQTRGYYWTSSKDKEPYPWPICRLLFFEGQAICRNREGHEGSAMSVRLIKD